MSSNNTISLSATSEYQEVGSQSEAEILLMASLKAPPPLPNSEDARAPIDLCCVIDRSGSMQGPKLDLVKNSLSFILQHLEPRDNLSVVLFDTHVDVLLDFTPMTSEAKAKAAAAFGEIQSRDCTNLSGGLLKGLELVNQRSQRNDVCSVLLFTDGMANEGITAIPGITAALEAKLNEKGEGKTCSVFAFGFGADHDENMLRAIAEIGRGMYYHVVSEDLIPTSFADCLGGLQSVVGQNILLSVEALNGAQILKSLNSRTRFAPGSSLPNPSATLSLGDMYSEEQRDVILLVRLPALAQPLPEPSPTLRLTLSYFNVITSQDESSTAIASLARPGEIQGQPKPHAALDEQRNRLVAADAIQQSREEAERGQFEAAKHLLHQAKEKIGISSSSEHSFCQKLVKDLGQCLDDLESKELYQKEGKKRMMRKAEAHYYQRSNRIIETEEDFYETSSKAKYKAASSSNAH